MSPRRPKRRRSESGAASKPAGSSSPVVSPISAANSTHRCRCSSLCARCCESHLISRRRAAVESTVARSQRQRQASRRARVIIGRRVCILAATHSYACDLIGAHTRRAAGATKESEEENRSSSEYNTSMFHAPDDDTASPSFAASFEKTPSQPYIPRTLL